MKSPLVLIGLAGAAYFATKKKPVSTSTKTNKPITNTKSEEKLPEVDKDLPSVDDEEEKLPEDAKEDDEKIELALYYDPFLQQNNQTPAIVDIKSIWISDNCMSWAVGKDYKLELPEKYLYANPTDSEALTTPWQWWNKIGANFSPSPWYLNDLPSDSPARAFASNVVDFWNKCDISAPRRKQFKTYSEYKFVFDKFIQTPLGKLLAYLIGRANEEMYSKWETKYPQEATFEIYKGWALKAILEYPKKTVDEQTTIAYHWAFTDDKDAPLKIDPKNPAHKPYKSAWMRINIEVKNYKGLIQQYGI